MANGLKFSESIMKELYKIYLKDSKKSFVATGNTTHYDGNKILPQPFALPSFNTTATADFICSISTNRRKNKPIHIMKA